MARPGRILHLALWALAAATVPESGMAQQAGAAPTVPAELDEQIRSELVAVAAMLMRDGYVDLESGEKAALAIEAKLAAGDYDDLSHPGAFSSQLRDDILEVVQDKHLNIFAPGFPGRPPPGAPMPRPLPVSQAGIVRADLLDGNVGYLEVAAFPPPDMFAQGADPALASLLATDGLIIDLRNTLGGSPDSVIYLLSCFLGSEDPVHVNDILWRNPKTETFRTEEFWSEETSVRYLDKPVIVLTSSSTFSAAEGFAYHMQAFELARIVGETTGGGAHPTGARTIGHGINMSLPIGQARSPITGRNWERVGVIPDVEVPREDALAAALGELGQSVEGANIDQLSRAPLFRPRTGPLPGEEDAIRRIVGELIDQEPDYSLLGEEIGQMTRQMLPRLHDTVAALGSVESIEFVEVDRMGAGVYSVKMTNGTTRWRIMLDAEGRAVTVSFR